MASGLLPPLPSSHPRASSPSPLHALQSRGSLSRRLHRFLLSLPLPLPVRRAIAAVPARLWLLALVGLLVWVGMKGWGGEGDWMVKGVGGLGPRVRERDPRLKWLDEHWDAVAADSLHQPNQQAPNANAHPNGQAQGAQLPAGMEHVFGSDGLVRVGTEAFDHPVQEILDRAEGAWEKERGRELRDMQEWEAEYEESSGGRAPPDAYRIWPLGHRRPPPLPSPFLQIFAALPPSALQRFQQEFEKQPQTFTLIINRGRVSALRNDVEVEGGEEERELIRERVAGVEGVVGRFARDLPDMRVTVSTASRPRQALPVSTFDILSSSASSSAPISSTYADILLIPSLPSSASSTCPPLPASALSQPPTPGLTFLYWPREGLDPCRHPYIQQLAPEWFDQPLMGWAMPVLGMVGGGGASDLVLPWGWPAGGVRRDRERGEWRVGEVPWAGREGTLYWRGPKPEAGTTHVVHKLLHPSKRSPPLLLPRGRGFVLDTSPTHALDDLLDLAFLPASSSASSSTNSLREQHAWGKHKFLLDLAVQGEEHRFPEMLLSGGVVFRAGVFRSWATERARAWVHYVPVMPDLSDLPALLHYFTTHDKEAQKIAEAGRRWAEDRQRGEDVEGAWFTTLVEYGRMYNRETDEDRYDY